MVGLGTALLSAYHEELMLRLVWGLVGLSLQPAIDYRKCGLDHESRKVDDGSKVYPRELMIYMHVVSAVCNVCLGSFVTLSAYK